jgi:hypothetical protein
MNLVASAGLPAKDGYFAAVQREVAQLLVLLPNQTFTPGVAPGYTGSVASLPDLGNPPSSYGPWDENAIVYAVDAGYQLVTTDVDAVLLDCMTDPAASDDFQAAGGPNNYETQSMVGGVATFNASNDTGFSWGNDMGTNTSLPPQTITVSDSTLEVTNTSSPVTLNP